MKYHRVSSKTQERAGTGLMIEHAIEHNLKP